MSATPLLLLPGLLCDADVWQSQVDALSNHREVVVAEYGLADSLVDMAHEALAQAPASGRFAVAGHSMGGRVALELWRLAAPRISHIALLDTGTTPLAGGRPGEQERAARMALLALAREQGMERMARTWAQPMVHASQRTTPLFERLVHMLMRRTPAHYEAQIAALLARPDATSLLPGIAVPALVLTGEQDAWSPPAQHQAMADQLPDARLVVVPTCGHMSPMERPEAVNAAFTDWLARV